MRNEQRLRFRAEPAWFVCALCAGGQRDCTRLRSRSQCRPADGEPPSSVEHRSGIPARECLTARISLPETRYQQPERRLELQTRLLGAVRGLPEVSAAGLTTNLPIGGQSWSTYFSIEGRPRLVGEVLPSEQRVVSSGYFEAMGIPLLAGRVFRDDAAPHPSVAVINDVLAKRFFPGENPLGHRVKWGRPDDRDHPEWFTIVGIVGSVRDRTLESPTFPELYMCSQQMDAGRLLAPSNFAVVVRSEGSIPPSDECGAVDYFWFRPASAGN
jgi:hypothetical protein